MSSAGRFASNQRPASSFSPIASKKPSLDAILADRHLLVASGRNQAGVAVVVGGDADVGQADRDDARHALHLLDDRLAPCDSS